MIFIIIINVKNSIIILCEKNTDVNINFFDDDDYYY